MMCVDSWFYKYSFIMLVLIKSLILWEGSQTKESERPLSDW